MIRRSQLQILLDILLSARLPVTCTQLMFAVRLDWKSTVKYLEKAVELKFIERRETTRYIKSSTRLHREQKGWSVKDAATIPHRTGRVWYKTAQKGEVFIRGYKGLWEIANRHSAYQGSLPFDTVGMKHQTMKCPVIKNRYPEGGGFDREWATVPSNSAGYIEQLERAGDLYIQMGNGNTIELQKMADEQYDRNREKMGLKPRLNRSDRLMAFRDQSPFQTTNVALKKEEE